MNTKIFNKKDSMKLKGVAVLLLVFHHCFRITDLYKGYSISFFPFEEQNIVNMAYASKICVSIFAFLSGYGLYLSYQNREESLQKWVGKRYIKTFSGYWLVWVLSHNICQLIDGKVVRILFNEGVYKGIVYSIISFLGLSTFFNTPSIEKTWWYMSAAILFILLTPIVCKYKDILLYTLVCMVVFSRTLLGYGGTAIKTSGTEPFSFMVPYMLGCIFARYLIFDLWNKYKHTDVLSRISILIVETGLVLLLYKSYHNVPREYFWEINYGLFPLAVIMLLFDNLLPCKTIGQMFQFFGKHSKNVFLIHGFLLTYLKRYILATHHFLIITMLYFSISLALSIILEKIKPFIYSYSRNVFKKA